jgi:hypothetical protein
LLGFDKKKLRKGKSLYEETKQTAHYTTQQSKAAHHIDHSVDVETSQNWAAQTS